MGTQYEELLTKFLEDNNILDNFKSNFRIGKSESWNLDEYIQTTNKSKAISAAFLWDSTPENWKFWYNIHLNWLQVLAEHGDEIDN